MRNRVQFYLLMLNLFLFGNIVFAQNAPIDFEVGGHGAGWTWTTFENDSNPPVEIVANPDMSGANTSATVAKITALQTGNPWAGCESMHGSDIGTFTLDATNSVVKLMVWKPVISDVGVKFAKADGSALVEIKVANTVTNQWEELTFDFTSRIGDPNTIDQDQFIFFPDFDLNGRTQDNVVYFDNVTFSGQTGGAGPTDPAPTPTVPAADVISVFSDAYANIAGTDLNPNWGQTTVVTEELIQGNNTLLYTGLNYQGIQLGANQDVSGMSYLHIDFWTANSTDLGVFLISPGPVETEYLLVPPGTTSGWVSVDIPLSEFAPVDLADVFQFKFDGNGDIYLDNIFFTSSLTGSNVPTMAAPTPTVPASDVISVFSDAYTNIAGTDLNPNWGQTTVVTEELIQGNNTLLYTGLNYQGIQLGSNQDVSGMSYLHIDFWTANSTDLGVFLISPGPVETEYLLVPPGTTGGWVSIDIPLSEFAPVDLADVFQFKFDGNGDIYLDNIYFTNTPTGITELNEAIPSDYTLEQNFPNPFNPTTNIRFSIPQADQVTVKVHNMLGQEVATLVNGFMNQGTYQIDFDASDLPTGIYVYSIVAGDFSSAKKMMLVK